MKEVWKDIPMYKDRYQVSNLGRIKSLGRIVNGSSNSTYFKKEKILKTIVNKNGYNISNISDSSGKFTAMYVHRLVMLAFFGNSSKKVHHIDENPSNNKINNLKYVTNKEHGDEHCTKSGAIKESANGRLILYLYVNKKCHHLSFLTRKEAEVARDKFIADNSIDLDEIRFRHKYISFSKKDKRYVLKIAKKGILKYFKTEEEAIKKRIEILNY